MTAVVEPVANPYCTHGGVHSFCPYSVEQEQFCSSPADEVFFGGAAGPGKTVTLLHEGLRQIHIPSYRAIFFRRTYRELRQVIEMSHETFPAHGGRFVGNPPTWSFPRRPHSAHHQVRRGYTDGAKYELAYCAHDRDKFQHDGQAYQYIAWDELTQYPNPSVYEYLFSRCRPLVQGQGVRCYVRAASNPGGPGHTWVKQRFIGLQPFQVYRVRVKDPLTGKEQTYTRQFIPATLDTNDIMLSTTNYETMLFVQDPEIARAKRHGDWNIAAGVLFSECRDGLHRVQARPPLSWTQKEIAVDWAYEGYAVAGWFETSSGVEGYPHSWQYREMVTTKVVPPLFARMLLDRTPKTEEIRRVVMDTNAWATPQDGGPPPAEQMMPLLKERGWKLVPATKGAGSRVRGWQLLHTYFFGRRKGGPILRIMDNCPVTWRQLTSLVRGLEPHDVEDLEPHQTDDALDMLRYFVQSRPQPAPPTAAELLLLDEDFDKLIDPRTYEVAKIEELRRTGFPAVKDRKAKRPKRIARKRRPW